MFQKISVSKFLMRKRGISRFSVEVFLSPTTEKLRWRTFRVPQNFWYRKILWIREGGGREYNDFLSKIFTVPKNFVGEPFSVSLISGVEKFYA